MFFKKLHSEMLLMSLVFFSYIISNSFFLKVYKGRLTFVLAINFNKFYNSSQTNVIAKYLLIICWNCIILVYTLSENTFF